MAVFKLVQISLVEFDEKNEMRIKEYRAYSLFEADRQIEQISRNQKKGDRHRLQFKIDYTEDEVKREYKGIFRFSDKKNSLSLQQHVLDFLAFCEKRPAQLRMDPEDFKTLKKRITGLFESCALQEMFKLNHKPRLDLDASLN